MHGGRSMFTFSPVREDGKTRQFEHVAGDQEIIGVHAGDCAGLNIVNPRPGCHYQWAPNNPTAIMNEYRKSGEIVKAGDDDAPAYTLGIVYDDSDSPTPVDTAQVHKDVVLMRYPEEVIAKRRKAEAERALRQLSHADDDYLQGASPAELASSQGALTRFAQRRHSLQMHDETGAVRKQWKPELGIIDND